VTVGAVAGVAEEEAVEVEVGLVRARVTADPAGTVVVAGGADSVVGAAVGGSVREAVGAAPAGRAIRTSKTSTAAAQARGAPLRARMISVV
jgi:hypothetical protein